MYSLILEVEPLVYITMCHALWHFDTQDGEPVVTFPKNQFTLDAAIEEFLDAQS